MENLFQEIIFWTLAIAIVGGSLLVVHTTNMFRAALLLAGTFMGVAGVFVLLSAEFLAVVQVLIYIGGVAILVIFAVMITRDVERGNMSNPVQPVALTVGAVLLGALVYAIVQAEWRVLPDDLPAPLAAVFVDTPAQLGRLLLSDYVLAFEVAGVLLLAVVIGALALVRERYDA